MMPFNNAAIAGIGQTEFSKASGRSELQLAAEASLAAIRDAGLQPADIDGMVTFDCDVNGELQLMRSLGIEGLRWTGRTPLGGVGACATVQMAVAAVTSGAAKAVLIYRAFNERSGQRFGQPSGYAGGRAPSRTMEFSYGLDTPAKIYSLWYKRYMDQFGVTNADLGDYVVAVRQYAAANPNAWYYNKPLTREEHQQSRWIVEPVLRLYDCCQETDGGVAFVVTTIDRARDLRQPPVRIAGASQSHLVNGDVLFDYYREDPSLFPEARALSEELWSQSGLTAEDIDVAMIYDNFSPVVFLLLEAHGFCGRGEAKEFIRSGQIGPGGKLPVNTNGGLLGEAYVHGLNNISEGVRQVRGTAANQVKDARHVFVTAGRSALILGKV